MKKLLLVAIFLIAVCLFISPGHLYAQEEFRSKLTSYFSELLELTQFAGVSADVQERIIEVQQKIPALTSEELVALREAFPQDSDWWNAPRNILASFAPAAQPLQTEVASDDASMRPIVPGVPPDCLLGVVEELFIAKGVVQVAKIAVQLTPGDSVVVVAGEGGTVATHPARIIAVVVLNIAEVAELALDAVNEASTACNLANSWAIVHDFVEIMTVHLQVIELKTLGCSQGFWKNHTELWDSAIAGPGDLAPTYDPDTLFDDVFGTGADKAAGLRDGATLLEALKATFEQARNAVTLLLNNDALNAGINLPCTPPTAVGDVGDFAPILGPFTRRFLLSSSEAGEPVDVSIVQVHASALNPSSLNFVDVTANTTATKVKIGVLNVEIELPEAIKDARVFEINVLHDHELKSIDDNALPISGRPTGVDIKHFGTILFHQEHLENLGMGQ